MGFFAYRVLNELKLDGKTVDTTGSKGKSKDEEDYTKDDTATSDPAAVPDEPKPEEDTPKAAPEGAPEDAPEEDYTKDDTEDAPEDAPEEDYTKDDNLAGPEEDAPEDGAKDDTGDDTGDAPKAAPEGAPEDGAEEDYTKDDGAEGASEDGAEEDYTKDDGAEDGAEDAPEDGAEDGAEGAPSEGGEDDLKTLETNLFSGLSAAQIRIKHLSLKTNFITLYNEIERLIERVNNVSKNDSNLAILEYTSKKLIELKDLVNFYITETYSTKTYIENEIDFEHCLAILNTLTSIIEQLHPKEDTKKTKAKNNK